MIIDVHSHVAYSKLYPPAFLSGMFEGAEGEIDAEHLSKFITVMLRDRYGDGQIKQMNEASINKSVLLLIDGGLHLGEAALGIEEIHEIHRNILEKFPERFIVFGSADPRRGKKGLDLFRKSINEFKFKGIKLYPPFGYNVTDKCLDDYYQICNENKLSVLIHTEVVKDESDFSNPLFVRNIAERYPNICFILAHALFNLTPELIIILRDFNNVYIDISGYSRFLDVNNKFLKDCFSKVFENKIEDKVLFGSDWPLFNLMVPIKVHIDKLITFGKQNFNIDFDYLLNTQMYNNAMKALRL